MDGLHTLHQQLTDIQHALAEDALERLPPLVETYRNHLHAWMAVGIRKADNAIEPLHELRSLHHQVIAGMQQYQQHLRTRMQAERQGSRAARTYLSGP